ncbi:protein bicaudal C-like [Drosophila montana]|uniref:protein bicaudal C-like n=1 Tax=Drosophila montana TaxID=40370 RepID=UPI00313EEC91
MSSRRSIRGNAPRWPPDAADGAGGAQGEQGEQCLEWIGMQNIARKLGADVAELHNESFKVDRHWLEQLLRKEGLSGARDFFEKIMSSTRTYVCWPSRLKIGAKSRKDPYVRVVGQREQVLRAKHRILSRLEDRASRVLLKMDISHTDHTFMIGCGGSGIKRIRDLTSTHIHFPDEMQSFTEQSNQVSVSGSLSQVEQARALLRLSTPLLLAFELPVAQIQAQPYSARYLRMIERSYNVQVIYSERARLYFSVMLVKGVEREADKLRDATQLLMNFTWSSAGRDATVKLYMEITSQHHLVIRGIHDRNLKSIMAYTQTRITLPELCCPQLNPSDASHVAISGSIDNVYRARQLLLGNLPVTLKFDYASSHQFLACQLMELNIRYGCHIVLLQNQRQRTVIIKGLEKFTSKIYEARRDILRLDDLSVRADIPDTYFLPSDHNLSLAQRTQLASLLAGQRDCAAYVRYHNEPGRNGHQLFAPFRCAAGPNDEEQLLPPTVPASCTLCTRNGAGGAAPSKGKGLASPSDSPAEEQQKKQPAYAQDPTAVYWVCPIIGEDMFELDSEDDPDRPASPEYPLYREWFEPLSLWSMPGEEQPIAVYRELRPNQEPRFQLDLAHMPTFSTDPPPADSLFNHWFLHGWLRETSARNRSLTRSASTSHCHQLNWF